MEAETALRGGATLIDVKEPAHGSLGRASDETLAAVVHTVAGRRPISAALGELADASADELPTGKESLAYLKWGLSRYQDRDAGAWQSDLETVLRRVAEQQPHTRVVAVAYADWQRARAPTPEEIAAFAIEHCVGAFLIDTWQKDGSTLLDWLPLETLAHLHQRCRAADVPIALAGSLGPAEIQKLLPLRPDWFAVRGAVCQQRQREGMIDEDKVRQLTALLECFSRR